MRSFTQTAGRASWRTFQVLLTLASLIAVGLTYQSIVGVDPSAPLESASVWLFGANCVLIGFLAWLLARRYLDMRADGARQGGGRLARRFLLLFSASAVLPASVVAIALGGTITRGLDNWFDSRIGEIIEDSASVARRRVDEVTMAFEESARAMAFDVSGAAEGLESDIILYSDYLRIQSELRRYGMAFVLNSEFVPLAEATIENAPSFIPPPDDARAEARAGRIGQTLYGRTGFVTALAPLSAPEGAYLYVYRPISLENLAQLRRAQRAVADYRLAEERSGNLQILFIIGYAQIVMLALLLFARMGLEAAGSLTRPMGRLALASNAVRDGDLTIQVPETDSRDEISLLTQSFNAMTRQLREQRSALVSSREIAEDRRRFLETLLSEISAGVVRTDSSLAVTLSNRSADDILNVSGIQNASLYDVAPDFAPHAVQALTTGLPVDASIELVGEGGARHIRLKAAPDVSGGCVLTFDDATRLVTAQRQLAWRDVARRIAHEIRYPLTPIQLSAERLRRKYTAQLGSDDDTFEKCLDTILRQVADIGRMVEAFSSFAQMPKPSMAPFDLSALVKDAAFAQSMVSPDLSISVRGADVRRPYLGDERLLSQALSNLLKNAAEALGGLPASDDRGGAIILEITNVKDGVSITIEDNGPGFPKSVREQLLEPYVTTRERGSGLGLAIVNRIIMDHGGLVALQDRADGAQGAKVRVTLPNAAVGELHDIDFEERRREPA
ncbi:MAG: ATP-binding protein [Pseudomonadota bacterium]